MKGNKVYILHIFDAILAIEKFAENLSQDEFLKSDLTQSAVIRKIEIIGEAVKNLSEDFKGKYQFIPWKRIASMRDKLIHEYFGVDIERVWDTIQKDLPLLKEQISKILKKEIKSPKFAESKLEAKNRY